MAALQRGSLIDAFLCKFYKRPSVRGTEGKTQGNGRRAKLRRAAPRDERNIEQVSGDMKN